MIAVAKVAADTGRREEGGSWWAVSWGLRGWRRDAVKSVAPANEEAVRGGDGGVECRPGSGSAGRTSTRTRGRGLVVGIGGPNAASFRDDVERFTDPYHRGRAVFAEKVKAITDGEGGCPAGTGWGAFGVVLLAGLGIEAKEDPLRVDEVDEAVLFDRGAE